MLTFETHLTELRENHLKVFLFFQRLARSPVLRGSSLLHSFLTPGSEITGMFEPDSVSREAERKVKSLKSKLIIEVSQFFYSKFKL